MKLLTLGYKKLSIEFDIAVLKQIMESDEDFLKKIREPVLYHKSPTEEYYLIHMVQMGYVQIVNLMMSLGADLNIKSRKEWTVSNQSNLEADSHLFSITYKMDNPKMLSLFMVYN